MARLKFKDLEFPVFSSNSGSQQVMVFNFLYNPYNYNFKDVHALSEIMYVKQEKMKAFGRIGFRWNQEDEMNINGS